MTSSKADMLSSVIDCRPNYHYVVDFGVKKIILNRKFLLGFMSETIKMLNPKFSHETRSNHMKSIRARARYDKCKLVVVFVSSSS